MIIVEVPLGRSQGGGIAIVVYPDNIIQTIDQAVVIGIAG